VRRACVIADENAAPSENGGRASKPEPAKETYSATPYAFSQLIADLFISRPSPYEKLRAIGLMDPAAKLDKILNRPLL
jgi:hypothetical protein